MIWCFEFKLVLILYVMEKVWGGGLSKKTGDISE